MGLCATNVGHVSEWGLKSKEHEGLCEEAKEATSSCLRRTVLSLSEQRQLSTGLASFGHVI